MASPLESAITLDDVFAMVVGKRVPLAPELAGYLSLEIAEKADPGGGDIDPKSIYIADEGTVALVRRREPSSPDRGDAEQSIRAALGQLLEASGSSTPALSAVGRRPRVGSLRSLMEELEAALIPVNRAAGRRALARLAREVKRVTLGVGRNASSGRSASGEWTSRGSRPASDEAPTARREYLPAAAVPDSRPVRTAPGPSASSPGPLARNAAPRAVAPSNAAWAKGAGSSEPPREPSLSGAPVDDLLAQDPPPPTSPLFENPSDVDSLLEQFSRSTSQSEQGVSRDLKSLVDIGETRVPPSVRPNYPSGAGADIDELLAFTDAPARRPMASRPPETPLGLGPPTIPPLSESVRDVLSSFPPPPSSPPPPPSSPPPPQSSPPPPPSSRPPEPARPPAPVRKPAPLPPPASRRMTERDLPTRQSIPVPAAEWAKPKKRRTDYWIVLALLAFVATSAAAVWLLKPGFLSGRTADKVEQEKVATEATKARTTAAEQANACRASVDVTDIPPGAEVLLRVGQAPVDVPRLPVGARLEFVATAEGYAPKRAVVPAGMAWDSGPDGKPRFELGVQLDRSNPKVKLGDPWPPGEPGSDVGGKGPPGTVHLISTPKGAELWMLAGLGPEAVIEQLPCDQSVDILVAGPTTYRKRLHAAASDFVARPGEPSSKIAKLSTR